MFAYIRRIGNLIIFTLGLSALAVVAAPTDTLKSTRAKIDHARDSGAEALAPMSLRLAENEWKHAQRMVASHPSEPLRYEHALEMAEYRVEYLNRVISTVKQSGLRMDELTAMKMVSEATDHGPQISKNEDLE